MFGQGYPQDMVYKVEQPMLRRNRVSSEALFQDELAQVHNSMEIPDFPITDNPSSCLSEIGVRDDPSSLHDSVVINM